MQEITEILQRVRGEERKELKIGWEGDGLSHTARATSDSSPERPLTTALPSSQGRTRGQNLLRNDLRQVNVATE